MERRVAREDEGVDGGAPANRASRLGSGGAEADESVPARLQQPRPAVLGGLGGVVHRGVQIFAHGGIEDDAALLRSNERELLGIPGFGPGCLTELTAALPGASCTQDRK